MRIQEFLGDLKARFDQHGMSVNCLPLSDFARCILQHGNYSCTFSLAFSPFTRIIFLQLKYISLYIYGKKKFNAKQKCPTILFVCHLENMRSKKDKNIAVLKTTTQTMFFFFSKLKRNIEHMQIFLQSSQYILFQLKSIFF